MSLDTFISLIAAVGVGTVISALVGHLVAVSNHRQAWINALRDDLAEFSKALEAMLAEERLRIAFLVSSGSRRVVRTKHLTADRPRRARQ